MLHYNPCYSGLLAGHLLQCIRQEMEGASYLQRRYLVRRQCVLVGLKGLPLGRRYSCQQRTKFQRLCFPFYIVSAQHCLTTEYTLQTFWNTLSDNQQDSLTMTSKIWISVSATSEKLKCLAQVIEQLLCDSILTLNMGRPVMCAFMKVL